MQLYICSNILHGQPAAAWHGLRQRSRSTGLHSLHRRSPIGQAMVTNASLVVMSLLLVSGSEVYRRGIRLRESVFSGLHVPHFLQLHVAYIY